MKFQVFLKGLMFAFVLHARAQLEKPEIVHGPYRAVQNGEDKNRDRSQKQKSDRRRAPDLEKIYQAVYQSLRDERHQNIKQGRGHYKNYKQNRRLFMRLEKLQYSYDRRFFFLHVDVGQPTKLYYPGKCYNKSEMAKKSTGIYDAKELARFFRVTEETICEWCKDGKLPAFKIGQRWRVRVQDLQKIIDGKVRSRKSGRGTELF